jgi:hypothetical protein
MWRFLVLTSSDESKEERLDEIISRVDATQRSQVLMHETLSRIVQEIQDFKVRQREARS